LLEHIHLIGNLVEFLLKPSYTHWELGDFTAGRYRGIYWMMLLADSRVWFISPLKTGSAIEVDCKGFHRIEPKHVI